MLQEVTLRSQVMTYVKMAILICTILLSASGGVSTQYNVGIASFGIAVFALSQRRIILACIEALLIATIVSLFWVIIDVAQYGVTGLCIITANSLHAPRAVPAKMLLKLSLSVLSLPLLLWLILASCGLIETIPAVQVIANPHGGLTLIGHVYFSICLAILVVALDRAVSAFISIEVSMKKN